ncbi:retinaldehyde-binding protein 1-like isoform X2 [Folsomia candida]|nr:retinaldehyde-binding protein 1-like isoform X2 [Folsomia candida]
MHETIFCLENYIELRTVKYKKFIQPFLPSRASLLGTEFVNVLSSRDHHGRHVAVLNISAWNPLLISVQEVMVTGLFIFDEAVRRYVSISDEFVFIANFGGVSFEQAKAITPQRVFQILELYLKCLPGRPKALHIIHENFIMNGAVRILKYLLYTKLRERIHVHSKKLDSLHEHVRRTILPTSLGGTLTNEEAFDNGLMVKIRGNDGFYKSLEKKSDEVSSMR